jgi:diacylglycerol kinase (ATP)
MVETIILANPRARRGQLLKEWDTFKKQILDALGKGEDQVQVVFTQPTDRGSQIVKKALANGAKQVLVIGGDGSISEAVQGFFEEGRNLFPDAVLMVLPAGRGDDFFKSLTDHLFLSQGSGWKKGLELIRDGRPRRVDIGRIRWIGGPAPLDRYFINIASFGFPGLVVQRVLNQKKYFGSSLVNKTGLTYVFQGLASVAQFKPLEVEIKVDGRDSYQGKITYGFILNGRYSAGGICWESETRIDDGLFNILVMDSCNSLEHIWRVSRISLGSGTKLPGFWSTTGKHVQVTLGANETKTHPLFEVDGEIIENFETRGANLDILPQEILIQMPNSKV